MLGDQTNIGGIETGYQADTVQIRQCRCQVRRTISVVRPVSYISRNMTLDTSGLNGMNIHLDGGLPEPR